MNKDKHLNGQRAKRVPLLADVELDINADIITAMVTEISDTGVRIDTSPPLIAKMRFVFDSQLQDRKAQLVWVKKTLDGCMSYGFEFISDNQENENAS